MPKKILKVLIAILLIATAFAGGWFGRDYLVKEIPIPEVAEIISRPLDKYSIENLSNTNVLPAQIEIVETLNETENFTSHLFRMNFDPTLTNKTEKTVTGLINLPKTNGPHPLIVMFRGYVDPSIYQTGVGTKRAGEYFSENGFITIAPDFLGYAGSSRESDNIFETRFQTYTTALVLLKTLEEMQYSPMLISGPAQVTNKLIDHSSLFIWGHSNGGQIAITSLEVTQKPIPTVLWAPVTKPFPYSILYYTDSSNDLGKFLRSELSKFEALYDTDSYSIHNYYDRINAPIQIHQGTADNAVPVSWSSQFVRILESKEKEVELFTYPGADHNLNPSWNVAVARSLAFFNKHLTTGE